MSRPTAPQACAAVLLASCFASSPAPAQVEAEDARFERVAAVVEASMAELGIPGVALGIFWEGRSITRGFGVTSVENPLPVTGQTVFQAGSITKTFTATALMRLVESGRLDLDAPVRTYLPGFRVGDETASANATARILLTHMGGWEGDLFDDTGDGDDALARIVERMASLEQVAPFDTFWSYNNAGFYVAGRLLEVATGTSYEDAIRTLLIDPLQLRHTF
ncbi:MAG TPA: serine hydrolase domain-containing protein, partial [Longimicrobium sp.]|nr:serine hydrolase domain-containing protein [Longimicrobium sp.]